MSVAEAKDFLLEWTGLEFDPKVVKAFLTSEYIDLLEVETPARAEIAPSMPNNKSATELRPHRPQGSG